MGAVPRTGMLNETVNPEKPSMHRSLPTCSSIKPSQQPCKFARWGDAVAPDAHNMVLQKVALDLPPLQDVLDVCGTLTKRKKPSFRVYVDAMVNTMQVKAGQVLTLPCAGE